jgi:hypothetical protein
MFTRSYVVAYTALILNNNQRKTELPGGSFQPKIKVVFNLWSYTTFIGLPRVMNGKMRGDLLPHFTFCKILDDLGCPCPVRAIIAFRGKSTGARNRQG